MIWNYKLVGFLTNLMQMNPYPFDASYTLAPSISCRGFSVNKCNPHVQLIIWALHVVRPHEHIVRNG